jgi:glycosyltransferase involved in cell wall biosynthesis
VTLTPSDEAVRASSRPRRLAVGFLGSAPPEDPASWSGTYASMVSALRARGHTVTALPWQPAPAGRRRARLRALVRPAAKRGHDWEVAGRHAAAVEEALRRTPVDVVLAVAASTQTARLRTRVPVVTATDATFRSLVGHYPAFTGLSPSAVRQGERLDRAALRRSARVLYSSRWAADAAVAHCGVGPDRVRVVPYGPNLAPPEHVAAPPAGAPRVLWVGMDWRRKGGATAVAAVEELRSRGVAAELVCVGAEPPTGVVVDHHERVDMRTASGAARLGELYASASALLLPSRADCTPVVLAEAAAYGLPAVVSDVGGIPEMVVDGSTGRVLPLGAPVHVWADALAEVLGVLAPAYRRAARQRHLDVLSWARWAETVERELLEVVA